MSDQETREQQIRDNLMLQELTRADGAFVRLMIHAQHDGSVVALSEGSCFTEEDIVELKDAHLKIVAVLLRTDERQVEEAKS